MPDEPVNPGTGTEKLRYCEVHKNPCENCPTCKTYSYCPNCEKCPTCSTYSYCPTCQKCYEPNCPDSSS